MIQYENPALSGVFLVPRQVEEHLAAASGEELKVLLYVCAAGGMLDSLKKASETLRLSETQVEAALAFWRGTGIFMPASRRTDKESPKPRVTAVSETPLSQRTPVYTAGELADAIESNEDVRSLLNFAAQKLGKILTPGEQTKLYALVDCLGLPCDLVMGVIEYCVSCDKKSVSYIERTAARMYEEDGIHTYAAFEEYISRKHREDTLAGTVRTIIGAGNRAFTKSEREIVAKWSRDGVAEELISAAYERTIGSIAKPSLSYMSKIIDNWSGQGIHSVKDLEDQKPFAGEETSEGAFRLEDYTEKPAEANEPHKGKE